MIVQLQLTREVWNHFPGHVLGYMPVVIAGSSQASSFNSWFSDSQKTLSSKSLPGSVEVQEGALFLRRSTAFSSLLFWHLCSFPFFSFFSVVLNTNILLRKPYFSGVMPLGEGLVSSGDLISLFQFNNSIAAWTDLFLAQFKGASINNSGNVTYLLAINVRPPWPAEVMELAEKKKVVDFSLRSCVMVTSQWFINLFKHRIIFNK